MKNTAIYDWARSLYRGYAAKKFKTRFSPKESGQYWDYWKKAQKQRPQKPEIIPGPVLSAAENFRLHRFCTYTDVNTIALAHKAKAFLGAWFDAQPLKGHQIPYSGGDSWNIPGVNELFTGDVKLLIEELMGSSFKLFYGIAARSLPVGDKIPSDGYNSFMWHADGGPPTCINMMFCLDDTDESNGALELAPTDISVDLLSRSVGSWRHLDQMGRTQKFADVMNASGRWYRSKVPAGSLVFFSNNLVHKGGLAPTRTRDVVIFHLYPSLKPFNPNEIKGVKKTAPIPTGPDF